MLLLAVGEGRTLSGSEGARFHAHVASCETCRTLTDEAAGEAADGPLRWVARLPEDAFDDPDLLTLPTVDPIVFTKGNELAQGGMGRITRARDRRLGRDVAIKEVLAPYLRARFEREAMITARLQHPAIVPIYEAGSWPDGSAFYTMRLVSGGTLGEAIDKAGSFEGRLALLPHVLALTEALGYAHSRRIVHRDLKPGNVLVGEFGETVVIDWGLAKELGRDTSGGEPDLPGAGSRSAELTHAGAIVGTPCFIAPEQAAGSEIDERADVYALGAILYNLLAGQPPYWDSTEHSADRLLAAAREVPPTPIEQLAPRTPADLRAIALRAMAHDPAARYPSAKEMAEELRRFQTGQLLGSRAYSVRERLVRWIRRHRAAVVVGAVAFGVLAIVVGISVQQVLARQRETRRALAESQLERGRQLLVDGDPAKAAPYLAAALAELPGDHVAQRLTAIALRDVPRRLGSFEGSAVAFTPGGDKLAIGRADGSIAWIEPMTGRPLGNLPALGGSVAALACSPDGKRLAVAGKDGAYLRDAITGAPTPIADTAGASGVQFLPDGRLVIVSKDAVILVGPGGAVLRAGPLEEPHAPVVSPDGAHLVVLVKGSALAWNLGGFPERPTRMQSASGWLSAATFDHEDVITAGEDGVSRWRAGQRVEKLLSWFVGTLSWIDDHTFLADGSVIRMDTGGSHLLAHHAIQLSAAIDRTHVITGGWDRTLRVWDLEREARPIIVLDAEAASDELVVGAGGRRAVSRSTVASRIELWDVVPSPVQTLDIQGHIEKLLAYQDRLAVQVPGAKTRLVATARGGQRVLEPIHKDDVDRDTLDGWLVAFRPQHDQLVTTNQEGVLQIYSTRDGQKWGSIPGPDDDTLRVAIGQNKLWHVAFSSDGTKIAISSERRVWALDEEWRLVTPRPIIEEPEGSPWISALALDDGEIITGYQDGMWKIWDARTGALLRVNPRAHTAAIDHLEVRGDMLLSAGWDPTLRLWALSSGEPRGVFKKLSEISISPGWQQLATVDGTALVSLWDNVPDRLLEQRPAAHPLEHVVFVDDDHVVVSGDTGLLELIDLTEPSRPTDELRSLIEARPRWQLEGGRAVERR